jgi:aspartate-semialdehyde dehydrogenase
MRHSTLPSVGILGATGAVGGVLRELLRDWDDVRYFASARSAGTTLDGRAVEEATPEALESGGLDLCFSCRMPCAGAPSRSTSRLRGG